ncbi:glycosyltransferase [Iningainema tapete]|uniref:Glycosyltransferase family 1 protein n=1 Tax=Iningainema tapete BLCC-T55 TaxID=2748662 RepID=A0A8J6XJU6_9CYAN|nr:glycosyltransferase [Iningainema tapete]MBD2774192.1 glycosyltransferase family 1 protein [Iningainema tapete BLCC-T55]
MSKIILTTFGSLGDLHPKVALGLGLRDRGHDVVFATHKEYRTKIESLGFEFHAIRPDNTALEDAEIMARMMDAKKGTEYVIRDWIFANLRETYTDLMNIASGADFIVAGDGVVAARLVAEKLGMKWAFCALSPASFCSAYDPPVLPIFSILSKFRPLGLTVNRAVMNFARWVSSPWVQPMYQLRQELGLPPVGHPVFEGKYSPYLVLALFSSVLAKPQPDWAPNTVITGFTFYDGKKEGTGLPVELQRFLDAGEPPIVFTLGSAVVRNPGSFYLESIQAAQQLNRRAVLLMGKNPSPKDLPESIIAVDYVPYSEIFPHACAIAHQGGIGTTAQALRSGHPTLVIPYNHDQPDNAARVERLGTSRTIQPKSYTTKRVVKELSLLNNSRYTTSSAELGRILLAEDGVRVACDEIEKQLNDSPVRR